MHRALPVSSSLRRGLPSLAAALLLALAPLGGHAQGTASSATTDDVIKLPTFDVVSTEGRGYVVNNTTAGLRTNQPILKIPQAITVLTRDFISDLGYTGSSDVLRFAGVANFFQGEAVALRGARIGNPQVGDFGTVEPFMDNLNIDSYEVIRGPGAGGSVSGSVRKVTRIPQKEAARSVTFQLDQHGMYRTELDLTGPIGKLGDGVLSYRLLAAHQDGDSFFKFREDKRLVFHPSLQFDVNKTTIRLEIDNTKQTRSPNTNNFVTPEGKLYTGAGRDEGYFAPNGMEDFEKVAARLLLFQEISDNWDLKVGAGMAQWMRYGIVLLAAGGVNWQDRTVGFISRQNSQDFEDYSVFADLNGRFNLGPTTHQTTLGVGMSNGLNTGRFWASGQSFRRPIDNPQMENVVLPTTVAPPANPGNQFKTLGMSASIQHIMGLFKDRLTLVGNLSYSGSDTTNISNIAQRSTTTTSSRIFTWPYRVAATFAVTDYLSVYVNQSEIEGRNFSSRDINLNLLPDPVTTGEEVGIKVSLLNGRINSTLALFKIATTNQAVFAGVRPDGISYFAPIGTTEQKGWDFDLSASINDNWQLVITAFDGSNKTPSGAPIANSYTGQWSVVTRYDFTAGSFKGLTVGAGASAVRGRIVGVGGVVFPIGQTPPPFITLDSAPLANVFANYEYKNWMFRLRIENVFDKAIPMGAQAAWIVDPSVPRTVSLSTTLKF